MRRSRLTNTETLNKTKTKGQAVLEYAGLIGLTVLALLAFSMQDYLKRAIEGKMRQDISSSFGSEQYYGQGNTNKDLNLTLMETWSASGHGGTVTIQ